MTKRKNLNWFKKYFFYEFRKDIIKSKRKEVINNIFT